jgi:hypothetical protein
MNRSITYKREAGSGSLDVTRKATKEVDDSITRFSIHGTLNPGRPS